MQIKSCRQIKHACYRMSYCHERKLKHWPALAGGSSQVKQRAYFTLFFKSCLLVRFKQSPQKSSKYLDVPNTETDPDFNTEVSSTDVERMCYSFAAAQAQWRVMWALKWDST